MSTQPYDYTNCECIGCKAYRKEKGIPEPDQNAAYNAKVREIADELISILYPESITDSYGLPYSKEKLKKQADRKLQICLPAARAMVAKMAKQFVEGFNSVYDFTDDPEFGPLITQQQIERGLIPNTKTGNEWLLEHGYKPKTEEDE